MKPYREDNNLSSVFMKCLRTRLRLPVVLLMIASMLGWPQAGRAAAPVVVSAAIDTDTRVVRLAGENITSSLKPGMQITGSGILAGTYIVQILGDNQVLLNQAVTSTNSNVILSIEDAELLDSPFTGASNWTKSDAGKTILAGSSTTTGTFTIEDGVVQVGGVNFRGRTVIHDVLSNSGAIVFGAAGAPTLNFTSNALNTAPFERVGSLAGGSDAASIKLTGGVSNTALAFGGNNATTQFTGSITGGAAATLIKEGTGVFTWINNDDASFNGSVQVEAGGMVVGGSAGLGNNRLVGQGLGSSIVLSNKPGASLTLASGGQEVVGFLAGGGRGASRAFPNGATGALLGNYLGETGGELILDDTDLILDNSTANQVFAYGGTISGTGGLTKIGNNTLELLGVSTYTGQTTLQAVETNNTNSMLRLGAFGIQSGVGQLGASGFGALPSTTRLLMSAGTAGVNRNVTFDLNGASQTLGTLNSSNTAGRKTVFLRGGELTIHTTQGNSGSFSGAFSGRGTLNVTATTGSTGWTLAASDLANNNEQQRGELNVLGGLVTLNDSRGALGDTVNVQVGVNGTLAVALTEKIGSLSGAGVVEVTANQSLVLGSAPAGSLLDQAWTGVIRSPFGGNGGLTLAAGGSILIRANQEYLGSTRVQSAAALHLDYSTGGSNRIPGTLVLNGGSVFLTGSATGEVISAGTTLDAGASVVRTVRGQAGAMLNLGNLQRNTLTGGALLVHVDSASTTTTGQAGLGGILGGYAVHRGLDGLGLPVYNWAVPGSSGAAIGALSSYSTTFGAGLNTDVIATFDAGTGAKFSGSTGSLRFDTFGPLTMTIGGTSGNETTTIQSGGILVTPNVGANPILIQDQGGGVEQLFGGGAFGVERELIVQQFNPRGSLTIKATIADVDGNPSRLTKTGPGTLILDRTNSYTGQTAVYGGVLQVGTGASRGSLGGTLPVINHGYLVVNRPDPLFTINNDITGSGSVRQDGTGSLALGGTSTYTGPTQVLRGTLVATADDALGSTDGLTSVATGAALSLSLAASPETVVLHGATLKTAGAGASSLGGSLILDGNGSIVLGGSSAHLSLLGRIKSMGTSTLAVSGTGRLVLSNAANQINGLTLGAGTEVIVGGQPATPTSGSLGRGPVVNNGKLIVNNGIVHNDPRLSGQTVIANTISGTGGFQQVRGTVFLTGDNTYSGTTFVGGNLGAFGGATGLANAPAELRVGADTYTGSLGTGAVTLQAASGNSSNLRFHSARNQVVANTINLNPFNDNTNARNATLLRQGLGTITLSGVINAGNHNSVGTGAQRAVLQSEGGGRLIISGTINNGESNRLNIINNGFVAFQGSNNYDLYGVISGNNALVFNTTGTVTLQTARDQNNTPIQSLTSTSNTYLQVGSLVVNSEHDDAVHDDHDFYVLRGATLQFNFSETIGAVLGQTGGQVVLNEGVTLTVNDNGTRGNFGSITGSGGMHYDAVGGAAWHGLFGVSDYLNDIVIGSTSQTTTVRAGNLADGGVASAIGAGSEILLGLAGSTQEVRLEYTGAGDSTNRTIRLNGGASTVRIAGSGRGALVLNGDIVSNGSGNKTLILHGQNATGNTINGLISEGGSVLTLTVNPNAGNNDLYGAGRWTLTNSLNDFSGRLTVNLGVLELAGSLGNGNSANSVMGDLTVARVVDLGTNNFDGRRYAFTGGGDNLGASGGLGSTGAIVFNDPGAGTATFGPNITFTTGDHSNNSGAGHARLVNDGVKVIVINGNLTTGTGNNRNWYLDGSNTGTNTINGMISNGANATISLVKEGTGTWRLAGANTNTGTFTIARGTLEVTGGSAIGDGSNVNLSNAGSQGSSVGSAVLRVLASETIGSLQGASGTEVEISAGQTLTLASTNQTYNGVISGLGGLTRTNNNGSVRIQTLTNRNTYEGATRVTTNGANQVANRIDVMFLADGGQASGIGASSNAASNLVFDLGTGNGGLRWIGASHQTTDRLFTLGAGSTGIWADGQLFGDDPASIKFTNTGAIAFLAANQNHTLTLRGSRLADNEFNPQITNNGSGTTNLVKADPGMWMLPNANSYTGGTSITNGTLAIGNSAALGTGPVTVSGTASAGLLLRGDLNIPNTFTHSVSNGGLAIGQGNSVWSGPVNIAGGNINWRLGAAENASLQFTQPITGTAGTGRVIIYGRGDIIMSGTNTYAGITAVSGPRLVLDYTSSNLSKLDNGKALELGWSGGLSGIVTGLGYQPDVPGQSYQAAFSGGTIVLRGGSHTESVSSTVLNNGASRVIRENGTAKLEMKGITRTANGNLNVYGTIDFGGAGIATTTTASTAGILAVGTTAIATVNGTDWATGGGTVNALSTYGTTFASGQQTNVSATPAALTAANTTTNSLRFNTNGSTGNVTLSIANGKILSLVAGGILVTKNMTDNVVITGGTLRRSASTTNLDTVIHHYGTGLLTINSVIANNSSGAQALTKTGTGTLVLGAANTITGRVNVQQGILQVGDGTSATANARLGNLNQATPGSAAGNPVSMSDGATLRFNVANPSLVYGLGQINGGGLLHLAPGNTSTVVLFSDGGNWLGDILVEGGVLAVRGNNNALGSLRATTRIGAAGVLDLRGSTQSFAERITFDHGATLRASPFSTTNTSATISGTLTLNNTTSSGMTFDVAGGSAMTVSGMIRGSNGFTKTGNGALTVSANQFQEINPGAQAGTTTPNLNPALLGQVIVAAGDLRLGNPRALGAAGIGNETIVQSGGSLDLRDQDLNWADFAESLREIIHVSGAGYMGTGALRNTAGAGTASHVVLDDDATLSGGGYGNASRLVLGSYDTNINTGSNFDGNLTRNRATIDGNGHVLTLRTGAVANDANGAGVTLRDPLFLSPVAGLVVSEGILRIEKEFGPVTAFDGLHAEDITGGVTIAYAGQTYADKTNFNLGLGPIIGARLNLWNNWDTTHTVPITMDGVMAAQFGGHNYIDTGAGTIPNSRTYLDGQITLTGPAVRNVFHVDASSGSNSIVEQANQTGAVQAKLVVRSPIVGAGGLTKTGYRELRLTNNNTFSGDVNVLRGGQAAVRWQENTVNVNGVDYQTYGDAEGWAEWGLTLAGSNARLSGTGNINLQRRGMITLDNTTRLDATTFLGTAGSGGNHNNRINDAASLNFQNGWLRIIGGTSDNTESLATAGGAAVNVLSGSNFIDLMPTTDGTAMTLTLGRIDRSPGAVLTLRNLDSTSTFGSLSGPDTVRVQLNSASGLTQVGAGTQATNKPIFIGLLGGIIPHTYLEDVRELGFNNANASDPLNQGRNMQNMTGSHFMTHEGGILRPLNASEYFTPADGLLDHLNGSTGQNVNLTETFTRVRENVTINALRFGPVADNNGGGNGLNDGTTLTSYVGAHNIQLYVDGTLNISSGMVSSAYFTAGNATSLATFTIGGTLNFGNREAIINNQNGMVRFTDGQAFFGNFEIRSAIAGTGGLTKTGAGQVVLDGANSYSGLTTVSNGTLFLRNGRQALGAGGAGNGVVLEGLGGINSGNGIQVGSAAAFEHILVKPVAGDIQVMRVDNDTTRWFANVQIDNVDLGGMVLQTPRISAGNSATSLIMGDIYGGGTPITHNVNATLSRIVQFDAGNNVMAFRGVIGDKADPVTGRAVPIPDTISTLPSLPGTRTNQNEVLRVTLAGSLETNFLMENQYNAVGRVTLSNGNMLVNYDPAALGNDGTGFWTNTAISRIVGGDSATTSFSVNSGVNQQGFTMNLGALFLTRPDQIFNMATWNATGNGAKFIGGLNTSGTVTFGNPASTGILTVSNSASGTTPAPIRAYATDGGTVNINMVIAGNPGTASSLNDIGFLKVGRGTVVLSNSNRNTAGSSSFELGGGVLVIDQSGQNVARLGAADAVLSGGVLQVQASTAANTTVNYATTSAANNVLQLRTGGTEVIAEARGGRNMTLNLGNNNANNSNANLTRAAGSTLNFVPWNNGGGTPLINLNINTATTVLTRGTAIPWATFGTAPRTADDFAYHAPGTAATAISSFAGQRSAGHYQNSPAAWTAGMNVSETGAGFSGALASNVTISTLRFDTVTASQVQINSGRTLDVNGDGSVAGGILVSSNTGSANKVISGGSLTTSAPELVFHQYGQGVLDVTSTITGTANAVITGPLTTGQGQYGGTGTVKFSADNTYNGRTIVTGAVLEFGSMSALGTNPLSVQNDRLTLNGGSLRWTGATASLQNRGLRLEGGGGLIDVVDANSNLIIGSALSGTQAGITSQDAYRGDLIKTGPGMLTVLGAKGGFQGLLDIREGTFIGMVDNGDANAGTTSLFGTNRSQADGTILRQGANMQLLLGNGNNGGDWNIEEYFTFEGDNVFTYGGLIDINANLATAGALDGQFNLGNRRPLNLNGVLKISGNTQFTVTNNATLRLGNSSGYISGSGDIIKDGAGQLHFRTNTPDWTGGIVVREGSVYAANQADVLGTGYQTGAKITLGDTDRQGIAEVLIQNPDGVNGSWIFEVHHDVDVIYNPLQTKRLGTDNLANGNRVTFHGDVTLNDNLVLLVRDVGISAGGEHAYVNYNGSFRDGQVTSGNLLVQGDDNNTAANDLTSGRSYGYAILNGDNSAWTGDVTISNNLAYNHDSTAILRLGNNNALTAANEVTLNYNAILQAGGRSVTIGSLITQGGNGAFYGDAGTMSSNLNSSSEIVENAASTPGTLRIHQGTPVVNEAAWDAFFRDGTLNSQFLAPGANVLQQSAALNIVKDGQGWATLTLDNDYTGSTTVAAGILQVGRDGAGTTGRFGAGGTRVESGAKIAGTGTVRGDLSLLPGASLSPGDLAGREVGTLFVDGDAIFASGSELLMQMRSASYNNPGALSAVRGDNSVDPLYAIWRNGVTGSGDSFASALGNLVTSSQHDMVHAGGTIQWGAGSQITLANDGYTPKAGDIFRLFTGSAYAGTINVGSGLRVGNETGTDLNLFELGGNFLWDVSLFNSHGLVMVVEADALPMSVPPPVFTSGPNRTPASGIFDPGDSVTLNAAATGSGAISYQWYLNGVPLMDDGVTIQGAKTSQCVVVVNFNTKGVYSVSATNDGGTTLAPNTVLVQVKDLPQITIHPTPRTVNPGSSVEFSVQASGQQPFEYQWRLNGEDIEGATGQTLTIDPVAEADEGLYSVLVSNEAGEAVSNTAALSVNDPVSFAVAQFSPFPNAYLGQTIVFSVSHDGTPRDSGAPFTYQWRKGGTPIANATGSTLTLNSATALMDGSYDVVVSNSVNSRTSSEVVLALQEPVPVIEVQPLVTQTLLSGEALALSVQAIGRPPLVYTWKRDGQIVASGSSNSLLIQQAAVADAGIYTCEVTNNTTTTAVSDPAEVVVVESATRLAPVGIGETATLVANVGSGPETALQFTWLKDGVEIIEEENPHISGITDRVLIISEVGPADDALYTCEIKGPADNAVIGSGFDLRVFSDGPQFSPFSFADATIFATYEFAVPFNRDDRSFTPSLVTAEGLPPGLTIDSVTGVISGRPTAIRKGGYTVTVTASNSYGSVAQTAILNVNDLSQTLAGVWTGVLNRGGGFDGNLGGRVDFSVTSMASYSGKLFVGGVSYGFKGVLEVGGDDTSTVNIEIPRKGNPDPAPLTLTLNLEGDEIVGGSVTDGDTSCEVLGGWRLTWGTKAPAQPATAYLGYHTLGLALAEDSGLIGNSDVPQGSGYAAFTATANGKLKIAGRMPDGEAVTVATVLGPNGEVGLFQPMYKALKPGGSLVGTLHLNDEGTPESDDNTLTGDDLTWVRPASVKATDRLYRTGFGVPGAPVEEPVPVVAVGGRYVMPDASNNRVVLDMPAAPDSQTNNAQIRFTDAGDLENPDLTSFSPDLEFSIGPKSKITVPKAQPPTINPAGTKVSANAKTGVVAGAFTLTDRTPKAFPDEGIPAYSPVGVVKRGVKFQGMIIRDNGQWVGVGYFLLPQLPQVGPPYTTTKTSPILSGLLLLEEL